MDATALCAALAMAADAVEKNDKGQLAAGLVKASAACDVPGADNATLAALTEAVAQLQERVAVLEKPAPPPPSA
jgi:hypothetical protein